MTTVTRPEVLGTGLIAIVLVVGPDPGTPVRSWAGGTCGNVLSILSVRRLNTTDGHGAGA